MCTTHHGPIVVVLLKLCWLIPSRPALCTSAAGTNRSRLTRHAKKLPRRPRRSASRVGACNFDIALMKATEQQPCQHLRIVAQACEGFPRRTSVSAIDGTSSKRLPARPISPPDGPWQRTRTHARKQLAGAFLHQFPLDRHRPIWGDFGQIWPKIGRRRGQIGKVGATFSCRCTRENFRRKRRKRSVACRARGKSFAERRLALAVCARGGDS